MYLIADSELLKQVLVKQFDHFTDRVSVCNFCPQNIRKLQRSLVVIVFYKLEDVEGLINIFQGGLPPDLTVMPGEQWRQTRRLISPTFSSGNLKRVMPLFWWIFP